MRQFLPISGWPLLLALIAAEFLGSFIANMFSYNNLAHMRPAFRTRKFEKNGQFYQRVFRIKLWKDYVPAVGRFDKKHLEEPTPFYISKYLLESLRAELTHIFGFFFAINIMLVTRGEFDIQILLFACLLNLPCYMIQRYNKPRFEKLLEKENGGELVVFWKDSKEGRKYRKRAKA